MSDKQYRSFETININNILLKSASKNWTFIFAVFPLIIAYYLQDRVFVQSIAKETADIPKFIENIGIENIFMLMLPYIGAIILFYIANIITALTIPQIELNTLHSLTKQIIES